MKEVKVSGQTPVSITYAGDKADYFLPVRTSTMELMIVDNQILSDLYTSKKNGVYVRVENGANMVWQGYVTPNLYSQQLSQNYDSISVTCIDPLGLLKYYNISDIYKKGKTVKYSEFFGKVLSLISRDGSGVLYVETNVCYTGAGGPDEHDIMNLEFQLNNFYDELDEGDDLNTAVTELLRPFCKYIIFDGVNFYIRDCVNIDVTKRYDVYDFNKDGIVYRNVEYMSHQVKNIDVDYISNNTNNPEVTIDTTYNKFSVVASTLTQKYGKDVGEASGVEAEDIDSYAILEGNVNVSKISNGWPIEDIEESSRFKEYRNRYVYLFNGVVDNAYYGLKSTGGVNGYDNMYQFYKYTVGDTSNSSESWTGSLLNFYGSGINLMAPDDITSKRSVDISKCITTFAPDMCIPPEFMYESDFKWKCERYLLTQRYNLTKLGDTTDWKWGQPRKGNFETLAYKNKFEKIIIGKKPVCVDINTRYKYSRTGTKAELSVVPTSDTVVRYTGNQINTDNTGIIPVKWKTSEVKFNNEYFNNFYNGKPIPVFIDYHKVVIKAKFNNEVKYFNGKDWVTTPAQFYLGNVMNMQAVFEEKIPDIICTDPDKIVNPNGNYYWFSLNGSKTIYVTKNNEFSEEATNYPVEIPDYKYITKYLNNCDAGYVSIILPDSSANTTCDVEVEFYTGRLFGNAGSHSSNDTIKDEFVVKDTLYLYRKECRYNFMPSCVSYCKAEHFDIETNIATPKSSKSGMFDESDIKYSYKQKNDMFEEMEIEDLKVNTYNDLVMSSASYILYNNTYADPNRFYINNLNIRPENYLLNAYINLFGRVRRVYNKCIRMNGKLQLFDRIKAPEISDYTLTVIGYTYDVKTDRYSITAVEDLHLKVTMDNTIKVKEVPHIVRNSRLNLYNKNINII